MRRKTLLAARPRARRWLADRVLFVELKASIEEWYSQTSSVCDVHVPNATLAHKHTEGPKLSLLRRPKQRRCKPSTRPSRGRAQ